MHVKARMPREPTLDLGSLVRAVVEGNQVQLELRRGFAVDGTQKGEPLDVGVARGDAADFSSKD